MSQERLDAACAAIRRVLGAATAPLARAMQLPAFVGIMLAADELSLSERTIDRHLSSIFTNRERSVHRERERAADRGVCRPGSEQPLVADPVLSLRGTCAVESA